MTAPFVDVRDISVDLGGRRVLDRVHLAIEPGELVGLIGPNGAGKTTLTRTILGTVRPASGEVRVGGRVAHPGGTPIGYVPQRHEFAWDFPVSVAGAVMTGLTRAIGPLRRPGRADWERVADALDLVGMARLADRPVGQLSGGQRQRVLVARALVSRPRALLLDEPFSGLDMPTQETLTALFVALARSGHAVLMTTHDIASALTTCDRVALLNRSIVADDTPVMLAAQPAVWQEAFEVGPESALLRVLKAAS
jgi:manganese/iron transport system ATP-binding protein